MITDEMLAVAAKELSLIISATFPDPVKEVHHFSLRFKRKMMRLIKKTNHPTRYLWTQRVAGFVLVLFVGFMIIFTASPTVRASVIGWIKEQYESYIEYFYPDVIVEKEEANHSFEITGLPEHYSEESRIEVDGSCMVVYSNGNGDYIDFIYSKDQNAGNFMLKEDGTTILRTNIGHYEADIYLPDNPNNSTSIIWYNTHYNMIFYISAVSESENLLLWAESVK